MQGCLLHQMPGILGAGATLQSVVFLGHECLEQQEKPHSYSLRPSITVTLKPLLWCSETPSRKTRRSVKMKAIFTTHIPQYSTEIKMSSLYISVDLETYCYPKTGSIYYEMQLNNKK